MTWLLAGAAGQGKGPATHLAPSATSRRSRRTFGDGQEMCGRAKSAKLRSRNVTMPGSDWQRERYVVFRRGGDSRRRLGSRLVALVGPPGRYSSGRAVHPYRDDSRRAVRRDLLVARGAGLFRMGPSAAGIPDAWRGCHGFRSGRPSRSGAPHAGACETALHHDRHLSRSTNRGDHDAASRPLRLLGSCHLGLLRHRGPAHRQQPDGSPCRQGARISDACWWH
jgi:hypothetical protein